MLIIGIASTELTAEERAWVQHPAVSGVILFTRNFASRLQVSDLVAAIRHAAARPLLLCVDQEGGRVQRFREGFTRLPALSELIRADQPFETARQHGWLMASEMLALGIDLSFAPVVDLGRGNRAIGDRALARDPEQIIPLAAAYMAGMHDAGMAVTLKHFPGHGSVLEDTHYDEAVDARSWEELWHADLRPFVAGMAAGAEAVMMAHVRYPQIDSLPAGYSSLWIRHILRERLGFEGVVISDDIGMAAAESAGGVAGRLAAHIDAGCDLVLVCPPALVAESLAAMPASAVASPTVIAQLAARRCPDWDLLVAGKDYRLAAQQLVQLNTSPGALA